ncbi:MAG: hypothetical protein IPM99_21120 [Rubrivivax sp.]|nr:hypothetical protein [Rubrivivax sp.]
MDGRPAHDGCTDAIKGVFNAARRVFGPIAQQRVRFEPGAEVLPGVRSLPAFGQSPGHAASPSTAVARS